MSKNEPETELFGINDCEAFVSKGKGKANKIQYDKDVTTPLTSMTEAFKQKVTVLLEIPLRDSNCKVSVTKALTNAALGQFSLLHHLQHFSLPLPLSS